jgi:hypothetical protein
LRPRAIGSEKYGHWLVDDITRARALVQRLPDPPVSIFVSRRALWRNAINLDEIAAYFRARSYTVIELHGRSFAQHVPAFSQGALDCRRNACGDDERSLRAPGATVVDLAPQGRQDPFSGDLAAVAVQRYAVVFGEPRHPPAPSLSSFTVDTASLDRAAWLVSAGSRGDGVNNVVPSTRSTAGRYQR